MYQLLQKYEYMFNNKNYCMLSKKQKLLYIYLYNKIIIILSEIMIWCTNRVLHVLVAGSAICWYVDLPV
jgi:hypothetical protein